MPDNGKGSYTLFHGTSVSSGLQILADGEMRCMGEHHPTGIYTARERAPFYDWGCVVQLHAAGVVASKRVRTDLSKTTSMVPLGLIAVIQRSVEEWVVHPEGCGKNKKGKHKKLQETNKNNKKTYERKNKAAKSSR